MNIIFSHNYISILTGGHYKERIPYHSFCLWLPKAMGNTAINSTAHAPELQTRMLSKSILLKEAFCGAAMRITHYRPEIESFENLPSEELH